MFFDFSIQDLNSLISAEAERGVLKNGNIIWILIG
jgi:hypothetical protein